LAGNEVGCAFGAQQLGTYLWPVSVRNDDAEAIADEADNRGGGSTGIGKLLGNGSLLSSAN
jgi:hypothetical protein